MKYLTFDGIKISKIALGCADLGTAVDKDTSYQLLDYFFAIGGNLLDTGRVYCAWLPKGANASESLIGTYLQERGIRNKAIIATKGGHPPLENLHISRINKEEVEKDLNDSLNYLGVEYIDIYFLHRDDPSKPVGEIMEFLNEFVVQGKIKYLGASNWSIKRILEANRYAEKHHLAKFSFSQIMWSYARVNPQGVDDDTLVYMTQEEYSLYRHSDLIVMAFSSQAQGFYSQLQQGTSSLSPQQKKKYLNEINLKRYSLIKELSESYHLSPTSIALNALINHQQIKTIPIIGAYSPTLLKDSLDSLTLEPKAINLLLKNFIF